MIAKKRRLPQQFIVRMVLFRMRLRGHTDDTAGFSWSECQEAGPVISNSGQQADKPDGKSLYHSFRQRTDKRVQVHRDALSPPG